MLERMTVNHEVPSSSLGWGSYPIFIGLVGFGSGDVNLKINMVTCIKWFLSYYKAATVVI